MKDLVRNVEAKLYLTTQKVKEVVLKPFDNNLGQDIKTAGKVVEMIAFGVFVGVVVLIIVFATGVFDEQFAELKTKMDAIKNAGK